MTWQPMQTAPKDGIEIVVYFSGVLDYNVRPKEEGHAYASLASFPHPLQIRWNKHLEYWQESTWYFEIAMTENAMIGWMPLPDGVKSVDMNDDHWTPVKHEEIYKI